jgi:hypothetical protein
MTFTAHVRIHEEYSLLPLSSPPNSADPGMQQPNPLIA